MIHFNLITFWLRDSEEICKTISSLAITLPSSGLSALQTLPTVSAVAVATKTADTVHDIPVDHSPLLASAMAD